ncbi:histidine--tRNA ligase [Spiribacter salinus]|uniref:histidine--tRNA ligase n=1 Tax=Spiribacter salinus TaxID=1335746 RepID=UPI001C94A26E|nr:histidine--tRNA ligase [Spiribacter salinus]MBY5267920.1 histidine--tRNA ligase [Spiribacter salinus]MDR9413736.1 histidine--tRNA ligase [Spiribacter sp.]MDR9454185.1 histidine--tRNA ligase [Spiribacter sp.]
MSQSIQNIRGFGDVLPEEAPGWQFVESVFRRELTRYGYDEIRLPIVEKTELFARSIGEVTDIVEKEMYTFTDRNGDSLTLRPEGTAGCVRAAIQRGLLHNARPRLWYAGPMFRHERPQKGRYRQFHQVGAEAFGLEGPDLDAEMILLSGRILTGLGLSNLRLELNNLGTSAARASYRDALVTHLQSHASRLDADAQRRLESNPLRVLDSKNPAMREVIEAAPDLLDYLDEGSKAHFEALRAVLDAAGQPYTINSRLVRGLDYYGGTVFEWVSDELGAQGTVLAGGRYDTLVEMIGGKPTPAIGFAAGIERLVALVEAAASAPMAAAPHAYMVVEDPEDIQQAIALAERLRNGLPALRLQVHMGGGSLKSQLRRADRSGAAFAIIRGSDEIAAGEASIKDLRGDAAQRRVRIDALEDTLSPLCAQ